MKLTQLVKKNRIVASLLTRVVSWTSRLTSLFLFRKETYGSQ